MLCVYGGFDPSRRGKLACFLGQLGINLDDGENQFGFKSQNFSSILYLTQSTNSSEQFIGGTGTQNLEYIAVILRNQSIQKIQLLKCTTTSILFNSEISTDSRNTSLPISIICHQQDNCSFISNSLQAINFNSVKISDRSLILQEKENWIVNYKNLSERVIIISSRGVIQENSSKTTDSTQCAFSSPSCSDPLSICDTTDPLKPKFLTC